MAKKLDWLTWVSLGLLILSGINVLIRVANQTFPILDYVLIAAGFFGILLMTYGMNEFRFKSLLDLVLFAVLIGVLGYLAILGLPEAVMSAPLIYQIFQGFAPLMAGLVVGGIVTIIVGLVRIKQIKK